MTSIRTFANVHEVSAQAAEFIQQAAAAAISARGRFTLAFTGGSTPEETYNLLAQPHRARQIDWAKWFLFWGDDRFVPPEDGRSNFGMTARALLDQVAALAGNTFPMPIQADTPAHGAELYENTLRQFFGTPLGDNTPPAFDLVLLGLGDDGHIASLFPGFPTLEVADRWVVSSPPGTLPPPVDRITFTYPVLNAARQVLFIVAGEKKAEAVQDVLEGGAPRERRPAAGIRPTGGEVIWMLDQAAAGRLQKP